MAKLIRNLAQKPSVTENKVQKMAGKELWRREMNADDIQIIKRFSSVVDSGLRYGAPPPVVGP